MTYPFRALVIDDDSPCHNVLRLALLYQGYHVFHARGAGPGLQQASLFQPDLVLLNLTLPDLHGLKALRDLRSRTKVPIIVLAGGRGLKLCQPALEHGADDYLPLPLRIPELMARLRALRPGREIQPEKEEAPAQCGGLIFDSLKRTVRLGEVPLGLSPREYQSLRLLAGHPGRFLRFSTLLAAPDSPPSPVGAPEAGEFFEELRRKIQGSGLDLIMEFGVGCRLVSL